MTDDVSQKDKPEGVCFAEKHIPESIWFNKTHILIIIKNTDSIGEWKGKYIIYDSRNDEAHTLTHLPNKKGYKIYPVSTVREK
ncbi:hypothetical protein [Citrobacter telavivensis]|uniref:hypothetical protein n=1 Tax=Citrobacter telavivensis TaxID=2653932 RepID=UPI00359E4AD9